MNGKISALIEKRMPRGYRTALMKLEGNTEMTKTFLDLIAASFI